MTIDDQKQRQQAIDPEKSFIVKAPAGSGKTELLIQRYLRLLALVDSPEEIMAITFTRKAAAEMQSRILTAIERAKHADAPQEEHALLTYSLARNALERDKEKNWDISENPSRLRIQTIDSLCASLSRQMPVLAQLGAQPEIIEDARPFYEQAAINTLLELESDRHWSDAIASLLIHLDNDLPRIKRLLVDMLGKRDQWLPYVTQQHDRDDMELVLQNIIHEHLSMLIQQFPSELELELCEIARFSAVNLKDYKPDELIVHCDELHTLPNSHYQDVNQWLGLVELLLKKDGDWRKTVNVNNGFPPAGENKLEEQLRKSMKTRFKALVSQLQADTEFLASLKMVRLLPAPRFREEEWEMVNALSQILLLAEAQLRILFSEQNKIDFTGMAQAAVTALGDSDVPTDLALHLDYQLHHLLVDEYQDISNSQDHLLQHLISAWSVDEGKSLFLVGDPMQSIYRFREAEVSLFINIWKHKRLNQIALERLTLNVNFRSQKNIVEWVNNSFRDIMPSENDATVGAVAYSPSVAFNETNDQQAINIYSQSDRSDGDEAESVISIIQSIKDKNDESTIAILVRSRTHLLSIIPLLRKHKLKFQAVDIEPLTRRPAIQDLFSLARAYTHLADKIAWFSVLRAPWCGLELESLHTLFSQHKDRTVWQCLNDKKLLENLNTEPQERVARVRDIFKSAYNHKQRYGLRYSVESIWLQLGGPATLKTSDDLENIEEFFNCLNEFDEGGDLKELELLYEKMNKLYAVTDTQADNSLQIMSMHKAKGLEFDHVILPGLGRRLQSDQSELMMWMQKPESQELIMAPIKETGFVEGAIYTYLKTIEQRRRYFEDARLLYVASTRAKQSLHLLAHANYKLDKKTGEEIHTAEKRSLLNYLWPTLASHFENLNPDGSSNENHTDDKIDQTLKRLSHRWKLPTYQSPILIESEQITDNNDRELVEYDWAGNTIKHVGSVVHRAIQWIADEGVEEWSEKRILESKDIYKNQLIYLGIAKNDLSWGLQQVEEALIKMLDDETGQWILSSDHEQAMNEYALTGLYNHKVSNIKIDRTFIDNEDVRWIIDYKTSRHEKSDVDSFLDLQLERYQEQLEKYTHIMSGVDNRKIRCGLYFPLLQGWRELV